MMKNHEEKLFYVVKFNKTHASDITTIVTFIIHIDFPFLQKPEQVDQVFAAITI